MVALLALPVVAQAQEAGLVGSTRDATGGALPGVAVRAVNTASGISFEAVTNARGEYQMPVRVGDYRVTAALSGFASLTRPVTLLVGQQVVLNFEMTVSGVQASVTVTGEAPLLDTTQSSLGGNIDGRQLQDLPVQGRNWVELVVLAPGARVNAVTDSPSNIGATGSSSARDRGDYELNVDGQQITQLMGFGAPQPRLGRDSIAEFQFLSSRFDATQGRSGGMQVNAITRSGTNRFSGTVAGYFRDDRFNAADFVTHTVLPYQDQQVSTTFGGPIQKDRVHFFGNYEYEREPRSLVWTTLYPSFNEVRQKTHTERKGFVRLDSQISPRTRLAVTTTILRGVVPDPSAIAGGSGGGTTPPSESNQLNDFNQVLGTLTNVLTQQTVNELKVGYAGLVQDLSQPYPNPLHPVGAAGPTLSFAGLSIPSPRVLHPGGALGERQYQAVFSVRESLTHSVGTGGIHALKLGAEYLRMQTRDLRDSNTDGTLDLTRGGIPADIQRRIPNLYDASTWDLAGLSPLAVRWTQSFGGPFESNIVRHTYAAWLQDDWTPVPRLTLNLGVRYDLEHNAFNNELVLLPYLTGSTQHDDTNNVASRAGFSFSLNDRTVIRGGAGTYFGTVIAAHQGYTFSKIINVSIANDQRPDFVTNPWNGPTPTYDQARARLCTAALQAGCIVNTYPTLGPVWAPGMTMPYSYQASIGLQRQLTSTIAVDADYVYIGSRDFPRDLPANVSYNPTTGLNYPSTDATKRPVPYLGYVSMTFPGMRSNYHALQTVLTKRHSRGWQASATYTLSTFSDANPRPVQWTGQKFETVPFATAPDLGGEYSLAVNDQRHRVVFNALWDLPHGFQAGGIYLFGSGERSQTRWGTDLRGLGGLRPNELRLRPDGTIVPRNSFVGTPVQRMDLRLQRRFPLGRRASVNGSLEVFNVFNHGNYGSYVSNQVAANYLQPQQSTSPGYASRAMQFGFQLAF
ncbi:MAG TPA: carboxypeptidase regulatory-like domain-containing protein [Vicinamibacterales bacterium]|nr:carboxypeptidase regulatory-like domain-containing protein [Vicinamibacterales bacterium]